MHSKTIAQWTFTKIVNFLILGERILPRGRAKLDVNSVNVKHLEASFLMHRYQIDV
jgi:hypothetical protein